MKNLCSTSLIASLLMAIPLLIAISCEDSEIITYQYTCDNGTFPNGAPDGSADEELCIACDAGYYLDNAQCVANEYTCMNGARAADGTASAVSNGGELCGSCKPGYEIAGNICQISTDYFCANGVANPNLSGAEVQ